MKSLISLSILSVCFVACQPSKAPEQKQTSNPTTEDTARIDSIVLKTQVYPPPPPAPKHLEFVAPTLDVKDIAIEESEELNEDFGAVALGVMLAYFGIKTLKLISRYVLGSIGDRVEVEPAKLKKLVAEMITKAATETGRGEGFLMASALKKEIDAKIDSGDIKTIGDIKKFYEDYQKKETK